MDRDGDEGSPRTPSAMVFTQANAEAGPSRLPMTTTTSLAWPSAPAAHSATPPSTSRRPGKRPRPHGYNDVSVFDVPGLKWYMREFDKHVVTSREFVYGRQRPAGSHVNERSRIRDSAVDPGAAWWTADEKERFFAAISRHSRFRSDLVAADVRTKTPAEVDEYITALRRGARGLSRRKGTSAESKTWLSRLLRSTVDEVAPAWIETEDELALATTKWAEAVMEPPPPSPRKGAGPSREEELAHWGAHIRPDELVALDAALRANDMADPPEPNSASAWSDEEGDRQTKTENGVDKVDPIARDDAEIAELEALPKRERTPVQRARLRTLTNRRRNRQNYRRRSLLKQGMTPQQIAARGGPDTIFQEARDGKDVGGAPRKRRQSSGKSEGDQQITQIDDLGAAQYVVDTGLDLFNLGRIGGLMEQYAAGGDDAQEDGGTMSPDRNGDDGVIIPDSMDVDEDEPSDSDSSKSDDEREVDTERIPDTIPDTGTGITQQGTPFNSSLTHTPTPNISFRTLEDLHAQVVEYIRPLIYRSIVVAEQATLQAGGDAVVASHVRAALAISGVLVSDPDGDAHDVHGDDRSSRAGSVGGSRAGTPARVDTPTTPARTRPGPHTPTPSHPPSNGSPSLTPAVSVPGSPSIIRADTALPSWHAVSCLPPVIGAALDPDSDTETTPTDDEDEQLDDALDAADTLNDKVEAKLLNAAYAGDTAKVERKRRFQDLRDRRREAQEAYIELAREAYANRRQRRLMRRRTERMPTYQLRIKGKRIRAHKSRHRVADREESVAVSVSSSDNEEWVASGSGEEDGPELSEMEEMGDEGGDGDGREMEEMGDEGADGEMDEDEEGEEMDQESEPELLHPDGVLVEETIEEERALEADENDVEVVDMEDDDDDDDVVEVDGRDWQSGEDGAMDEDDEDVGRYGSTDEERDDVQEYSYMASLNVDEDGVMDEDDD